MAFRFFKPPTAPVPPRPAERSFSFSHDAYRTLFSPACPMAMTLRSFSPYFAWKCLTVAWTPCPRGRRRRAVRPCRPQCRRTSVWRPRRWKSRPSNPGPSQPRRRPPWWLSVTPPVRGDLVTTAIRPLMFAIVPVKGPFMKQRMLPGRAVDARAGFEDVAHTEAARTDVLCAPSSPGLSRRRRYRHQIDAGNSVREATNWHRDSSRHLKRGGIASRRASNMAGVLLLDSTCDRQQILEKDAWCPVDSTRIHIHLS